MVILNKQVRQTKTGKEVSVRTLGHNFWISESEARHYLETEQLFFKANKPVFAKDFEKVVSA